MDIKKVSNLYCQEKLHITNTLITYHFPPWALNKLQVKFNHRHITNSPEAANTGQHNNTNNTRSSKKNIFMVIPYTRGLSERFKETYNSLGMQVHFKGSNTICILLMAPKDKDKILQRSGVIYWSKCLRMDCPEEYIGKKGRTFGDRFRKHHTAPYPIHQHSKTTEHPVGLECFKIVEREAQGVTRTI